MTASEWGETLVGFVIPTAVVIWGILILWRWSRPGIKQPGGWVGGIIEFVLTCVFVILIILAWELFKTWKRQVHSPLPPRTAQSERHRKILDDRGKGFYFAEDRTGASGVREYIPMGCPEGSVRTAIAPTPSGRLNGNPGTTAPPSSAALLQLAGRSVTCTYTTPLNGLIFPSATRSVPIGVPPPTISAAWSEPCTGSNRQPKSPA